MTLKGEGKGPLPPLLRQYVELVERHPDYLLLFQVGDFYECFGEDAERLARVLGLVLTHKTSKDFTTPMAGIPLRSAESYIERLLGLGLKVAVADQVESFEEAEGLVRRDITQLITPGTVTSETLLKPDANYLAAVATGDGYGLALLDITTGEFRGTHLYARSSLYDELQRYRPVELLLTTELYQQQDFRQAFKGRFPVMLTEVHSEAGQARSVLEAQFGAVPVGMRSPALIRAAGSVLSYALATQHGRLPQVTTFLDYDPGASMQLDEITLETLEIFTTRKGTGHTLFRAIDETRTAPGRRLLKAWLRHPLLDATLIGHRLDAVEAFARDDRLRKELRKSLHRMYDLERLATRLVTGRISARDLTALARSLNLIPQLTDPLHGHSEPALQRLSRVGQELEQMRELISAALVEDPPQKITEGGLLRDGFDQTLDTLRSTVKEGRSWIETLEATERATTGIPTLKIGFNGVFGYYFEITRPYYQRVPDEYRPLQTLKDRQRYTRSDLRDKEREILRAEGAAKRREYTVFDTLRKDLTPYAQTIGDAGAALAELDVYASLAHIAVEQGYCRPTFNSEQCLHIDAGRHPVVERHQRFIPNGTRLSSNERVVILTGPNMSGKSTYLRQTALISLLAQSGSFVPAAAASLPIFDRIYTRIGASDDIAGGRSTFLVEMDELARILQSATPRSLVLLDEIGRGTSTFDGLALAWAAVEHLHDPLKAFTLFATHYFELTQLPSHLPAAHNLHVAAEEEQDHLVFYHQVLPGPASKAYGLEVARLAGIPKQVLHRARAVFAGLESQRNGGSGQVLEDLLEHDLDRLSPLEALRLLQRLQEKARGLTD